MAIDPRKLKPAQLSRLLNSTPLGEAITERQLHRHRNRAGFRIGEGKHVDLLKYTAWLAQERHYTIKVMRAKEFEGIEDVAALGGDKLPANLKLDAGSVYGLDEEAAETELMRLLSPAHLNLMIARALSQIVVEGGKAGADAARLLQNMQKEWAPSTKRRTLVSFQVGGGPVEEAS